MAVSGDQHKLSSVNVHEHAAEVVARFFLRYSESHAAQRVEEHFGSDRDGCGSSGLVEHVVSPLSLFTT
jgi:hypothetical protein